MQSDASRPAVARAVSSNVDPPVLGAAMMHERLIHRISIYSGNDDNTCVDTDLIA